MDDALSAFNKLFNKLRACVESEADQKTKVLHIDCGGEFTSKEFEGYHESLCAKQFFTVPYLSQQNGAVERIN